MKTKAWMGWLLLLGFLLPPALTAQAEDSLSVIRKVYLYHTLSQPEQMLNQLEKLDTSGDGHVRRRFIAGILEALGDHYRDERNENLAKTFYRTSLHVDPDGWKVFNKLNALYRSSHGLPLQLSSTLKQVPRLLRNFTPAFLLLNRSLHALPLSLSLILLILSLVLFFRYFRLAQTDLFRDKEWRIHWVRLGVVLLLLVWPLAAGMGWGAMPFLLFGFLWVYTERIERRSIVIGIAVFVVALLLGCFQQVLDRHFQSPAFMSNLKVFQGRATEPPDAARDPRMVIVQAFNEYSAGNLEKALELLESTGEEFRSKLKYQLLAGIQYRFDNITECIANLRLALQLDDGDPVSLNNFTLALVENGNSKLLESYIKRYPQIRRLKGQYLKLREPERDDLMMWRRLFRQGRPAMAISRFMGEWSKAVASHPGLWSLLLMILYILLVPRILPSIGRSISCSKCGRHINRNSIHRSYKLCNECYQLFMIKDVMFLEAKVIKEKELIRRRRKGKALILLCSLFAPGINLLYRGRMTLFILSATPLLFLGSFYLSARRAFQSAFGEIPLFLTLVGGITVLGYILINLISLRGEEDGI